MASTARLLSHARSLITEIRSAFDNGLTTIVKVKARHLQLYVERARLVAVLEHDETALANTAVGEVEQIFSLKSEVASGDEYDAIVAYRNELEEVSKQTDANLAALEHLGRIAQTYVA